MRKLSLTLILAGSMLAATSWATAQPVLPDNVKWVDNPALPGAKQAVLAGDPAKPGLTAYRVRFPANFQVPAHYHPVDENVTVISGTIHVGMGDKMDMAKGTAYPAGSFSVMPANMRHYAWTKEETVVQVNIVGPTGITFVNPADDPRKK